VCGRGGGGEGGLNPGWEVQRLLITMGSLSIPPNIKNYLASQRNAVYRSATKIACL
jgi:hypothetical protein